MELQFPLLGVDKGRTTSQQPQLTTPAIKNMRPYDTLDSRARGGQRPGLDKKYSEQISATTNPIVALCSVTVVV